MWLSRWLVATVMAAVVSPTVAGVSVNHARGVDFSQYRTFSWVQEEMAGDPVVHELVKKSVTHQLITAGLERLDQRGELLVRARVVEQENEVLDVDILDVTDRWGDEATALKPTGEYMREIGVGTLVVDLLDGHSKLQVWRGMAEAVSRPQAGEKSEKRLDRVIGKMFKGFPPGGGRKGD